MTSLPPAPPVPLATGTAWTVSLVAVGVIALGTVGLRLWDDAAWAHHTEVRAEYETLLADAEETARGLDSDLRDGATALTTAETISTTAAGFVGEDAVTALDDSRATFTSELERSTAESTWSPERVAPLESTALLWEVLGTSARLSEASDTLAGDRTRLDAVATRVRTAMNALNRDAVTVINAAGELGEAELTKYPAASNDSYRELKTAAESASALTRLSYRAADIVGDIVTARDAVAASHRARESAKSGPLKAVKNEVEAFARSLAGGVRIDFTWRDIVIGHGQGRSAAGTATWDTADTGYSSITLTNSIARYWNSWAGYRSLVAHEVGHAITSKCYDLFNGALFKGDNERWATAWAIGRGFTVASANGSELYGKPTSAQIEATKKCR